LFFFHRYTLHVALCRRYKCTITYFCKCIALIANNVFIIYSEYVMLRRQMMVMSRLFRNNVAEEGLVLLPLSSASEFPLYAIFKITALIISVCCVEGNGKRWRCRACSTMMSLRKDSFYSRCRLPLSSCVLVSTVFIANNHVLEYCELALCNLQSIAYTT